jgi:hypothetical protein
LAAWKDVEYTSATSYTKGFALRVPHERNSAPQDVTLKTYYPYASLSSSLAFRVFHSFFGSQWPTNIFAKIQIGGRELRFRIP